MAGPGQMGRAGTGGWAGGCGRARARVQVGAGEVGELRAGAAEGAWAWVGRMGARGWVRVEGGGGSAHTLLTPSPTCQAESAWLVDIVSWPSTCNHRSCGLNKGCR